MLDRISDFYRIVHPEPSDALISQRKDAIDDFVEHLSDCELLYACTDIACFGIGSTPNVQQTKAAQSIVASIQTKQPSFSSDIGANSVDIRVFAGIAVGEYLDTVYDDTVAALVISALSTRVLPSERYLATFISAFLEAAIKSNQEAAAQRRRRPVIAVPAIKSSNAATLDIAEKSLAEFTEAINQNIQSDREELQILWYVFGAHSITLAKPLQSLDISHRVLATAIELAQLVLLPPIQSASQFLYATVKEDAALSLRQLIEPCSSELLGSMMRHNSAVGDILSHHPSLLPLTWLSNRRLESGMSSGWESEFEQKTHLSASEERSSFNWALQTFNECIASRLLLEKSQAE